MNYSSKITVMIEHLLINTKLPSPPKKLVPVLVAQRTNSYFIHKRNNYKK